MSWFDFRSGGGPGEDRHGAADQRGGIPPQTERRRVLLIPGRGCSRLTGVLLLVLSAAFLTCGHTPANAEDTTPPYVVSTDPPNGATGVSTSITQVSITFSEEMDPSYTKVMTSLSWGTSSGPPTWSSDHITMYITRTDPEPLSEGATITIWLLKIYDLAHNLLPEYGFSFTVGPDSGVPPTVLSTDPPDGAKGVSYNLEVVSITFSKPMNTSYQSIGTNFPSYSLSWHEGDTVLHLTRDHPEYRLAAGFTYTFLLNGEGYENFRDKEGHFLPETVFSFTIAEDYEYELLKIGENPGKGFHWPYYLSLPKTLGTSTVLLVEPNNTGMWSNNQAVHDTAAENLARWRSGFAVELDVPLLVPTFPRPHTPEVPGGIYTHALDHYSLLTEMQIDGRSIARVDLQLMAMIDDAKERLSSMGFEVAEKVFMMGFSASGAFVSRFTLLHPPMVKAVAPGAPGAWPTAPVGEWNSVTLKYPVGIYDLEALSGEPFDLQAYRRVPHYTYVGDLDTNDALDLRNYDEELESDEIDAICGWLNCDPFPLVADRWPLAQQMYGSVQAASQFVVYPGVAHTITQAMFDDIKAFFEMHRGPEFTLADAIALIQVMAGIPIEHLDGGLDLNGDNQTGLEDAALLLQQIGGLR